MVCNALGCYVGGGGCGGEGNESVLLNCGIFGVVKWSGKGCLSGREDGLEF